MLTNPAKRRPDPVAFSEKSQKSGLESVFGIVAVVENSAADAQDHRAMTPNQGFKSSLFAVSQEGFEQLFIPQPRKLVR